MRLKNIKGAKERINMSPYLIKNPNEYKGKYETLFNNSNEIHLEIGTGKGDFLIGMAMKYPDVNFVGIEMYDSVLIRAIEKVDKLELNNIYFIREDATNILNIFSKEIDKIYLNFSDPWPKERHAKRRLTSPVFLKKYDEIFKKSKVIQMKTDNRKLFEYSLITLTDAKYKIEELNLNLYKDEIKDNVATEYEQKFVALGQTIYRGLFKKD